MEITTFRIVGMLCVAGAVGAVALHYIVFGPRDGGPKDEIRDVKRLSIMERLIHGVLLVSFMTLAITGFAAGWLFRSPLTGWLRVIHIIAAPFFAAGLTATALRWAEDCKFVDFDLDWVKKCGGYLGNDHGVPAGRFNAGQKGFFWAVLGLSFVIILSGIGLAIPTFSSDIQQLILMAHGVSSLLMVLAVVAHIYLTSAANPGTLKTMITGHVSKSWAKHHHPMWWKQINSNRNEKQD